MKKLILAIGTGLGVGYSPFFPGTIGSLWAVGIYVVLGLITRNLIWQLIVISVVFTLGVWVSGKCESFLQKKDHSAIVIDEIAGMLVALAGIGYSVYFVLLGFIFFRLFDIVKPFHIEKLQKLKSGWGVMIDDLAVGFLTNLFLRALISMLGW